MRHIANANDGAYCINIDNDTICAVDRVND